MESVIIALFCIALILIGAMTIAHSSLLSTDTIATAWREMEKATGEIARTNISSLGVETQSGGTIIAATLSNTGEVKQQYFSQWDVIAQYYDAASNYLIKRVAYSESFESDWSATGINSDPTGITTDEHFVWVADGVDAEVYKYTMNGAYTAEHWDTSTDGCDDLKGITTDGQYIWVVDDVDDEVYKYGMDGVYTAEHWDTSACGCDDPEGIATDGQYIWVVDDVDDEVYKFEMNGTYTTEHWDTSTDGCDDPKGISSNGQYIWVVDDIDDEVYKYGMDGSSTGVQWDTAASGCTAPVGLATDGEGVWVADDAAANGKVYVYVINGWTVEGIYLDAGGSVVEVFEPGIFNPDEEMVIQVKIDPAVGGGTTNMVTLSTPNGVSASAAFTG